MFELRTVRDVERRITQSISTSPDGGLASLREALAPFACPPAMTRLVEVLLDDRAALEQIAARSYLHVNGFDKLILASTAEPEWELRLHLWWTEARPVREHGGAFRSHNHRWDYSSYLVTGNLHVQHFEVAETGSSPELYLYRYHPPGRGSDYAMELLGVGSLRCVFDSVLGAGTHYSLSHRVQHSVTALAGCATASLVLRGRAVEPDTLVFAESQVASPESIAVSRLDADGVAHRMEHLLARLRETQRSGAGAPG